jgi:large subunit ribosomal protein L25
LAANSHRPKVDGTEIPQPIAKRTAVQRRRVARVSILIVEVIGVADILNVIIRKDQGKRRNRRLRQTGQVPAILYGHGLENVCLSVAARDVNSVVRRGSHFVELQGAVTEHALISEVQWDQIGAEVLHVDLTRVDLTESVDLELPVDLRGQAVGTTTGGVLNQFTHLVRVRGAVNVMPDRLVLRVNNLEVGQSLKASDIPLPEGVTLLSPADEVIVECHVPVVVEEEAPVSDFAAEPELVGRKEGEEGEEKETP